ncbi:MAG: type III-B CRISPR module RAMP protein Cmr4 [Firmicutes bacterium]|nr:type III-B CRISPR module RAMP protein Cmr4 [Bacillota bacterium]
MNGNNGVFDSSRMYWIHALTPLHVGSGRGISFIDLPIMREKITGWPIIPGSSVKGVWLDYANARNVDESLVGAAFGKASDSNANDHSGSFAITDARIVLLPVRSLYGTFAYVTAPLVLKRLVRDMEAMGMKELPKVPEVEEQGAILVTRNSVLVSGGRVFFEDLDFSVGQPDGPNAAVVDEWAGFLSRTLFEKADYHELLKRRLALVPDSAFDFLCQQGTEVNARIRIDNEKKTTARGALWYEECLPAESVLAGIVWCERVFGSNLTPDELLDKFCKDPINCQMGGKATVGKGYVRCLFAGRGD